MGTVETGEESSAELASRQESEEWSGTLLHSTKL